MVVRRSLTTTCTASAALHACDLSAFGGRYSQADGWLVALGGTEEKARVETLGVAARTGARAFDRSTGEGQVDACWKRTIRTTRATPTLMTITTTSASSTRGGGELRCPE